VAKMGFTAVPVFYGTDRNATGDNTPARFYGNTRGEQFRLGICIVSIPKDHRIGALESPTIWRLELQETPSKHVVLRSIRELSSHEFFASLQSTVAKSPTKQAFVFVHGFNVPFRDAARRTAQIAYDLNFDGPPILYSWPSRAELSPIGYTSDEANVEWTIPHLKNFLREIATQSGAQIIHLIAHSMGNRALSAALRSIGHQRDGDKGSRAKPTLREKWGSHGQRIVPQTVPVWTRH
jgi:esterase/lipase superfamily enzyme